MAARKKSTAREFRQAREHSDDTELVGDDGPELSTSPEHDEASVDMATSPATPKTRKVAISRDAPVRAGGWVLTERGWVRER